jgi:DNA-binding NarL/FixJ family response regulator
MLSHPAVTVGVASKRFGIWAILDISMPGLTGLEILTIANSEGLSTRLVFFTASIEDRELVMSAAAGAYGIIPKDVALEILVRSLR